MHTYTPRMIQLRIIVKLVKIQHNKKYNYKSITGIINCETRIRRQGILSPFGDGCKIIVSTHFLFHILCYPPSLSLILSLSISLSLPEHTSSKCIHHNNSLCFYPNTFDYISETNFLTNSLWSGEKLC